MKKINITFFTVFLSLTLPTFGNQGDAMQSLQTSLQAKTISHQSSIQGIEKSQSIRAHSYQHTVDALSESTNGKVLSNIGGESKQPTGAIVFVSLGMPEGVLRPILQQAHQLGIPVVVRGALDNQIRQSAKVLFEVLHPKNEKAIEGGVVIDPTWFKTFGITQVPAVVVIADAPACHGEHCPIPAYDVVYGNIPIPKALKLIIERGDASKAVAQSTLNRMGKSANAY